MPKKKGARKPRKSAFPQLRSKMFTHIGGPKGRSGHASGYSKQSRKRANQGKRKRKHGRK